MSRKVLRSSNLLARLKDLLSEHTHVDLATAWATGGEHLRVLADAANRGSGGVKVRALVGIRGNATSPDALEELSRIADGDLRIVESDRLFHPKLYLFERRGDGIVERQAWIGSANFTEAGFGGHSKANEEIMLAVGPGEMADGLAAWFQERWDHYPMVEPVSEVIRRYRKDWKRNPPHPNIREITTGSVSQRRDLLDGAHRPQSFAAYQQALSECETMLRDMGWEILNPRGRSYMAVISRRRELLLGDTSWSRLEAESKKQLMGLGRAGSDWWGLMGRVRGGHVPTVLEHETKIRANLETVVTARDTEFPDIAVDAMRGLTDIDNIGHGTATLLLTLARPDRLLSLNGASGRGLGALSGKSRWTLGELDNYRDLLRWLYGQPWYTDGPPADEDSERIWRFRAAFVDAFVYEPGK